MVIQSFLVEGEEILARAGEFYASNKRLLRYKQRLKGEELDDIPYSHIASLGVVRRIRWGLVKAGTITAIIGLSTLLTVLTLKPVLQSVSGLWGSMADSQVIPGVPFLNIDLGSLLAPIELGSIVALLLGLLMVVLGITCPEVYIQFRASGLKNDAEAKFRLNGVHNEASLKLLRVIRQQSLPAGTEAHGPENVAGPPLTQPSP